jgi:hypothetical protein
MLEGKSLEVIESRAADAAAATTFTRLHVYTFTRLHVYTFTRLHVYTFTRLHVYTFTRLHVRDLLQFFVLAKEEVISVCSPLLKVTRMHQIRLKLIPTE